MAKSTLAQLIHAAVNTVDENDNRCDRLILFYKGRDNAQETEELQSYVIPDGTTVDVKEIARMFDNIAEAHAQGLAPGQHQFEIVPFYGESNEPGRRIPFRKAGEVLRDAYGVEGPSEGGIISQMMRHTEAMARTMCEYGPRLFEQQNNFIEQMSSRMQALMTENHDAQEIVMNMLREKVELEYQKKREILEMEEKNQLKRDLIRLLPPLANTILGREVFPQGTADTHLLETIAEKITPEDAMKLASNLDPTLAGLLMERFSTIIERKQLKG